MVALHRLFQLCAISTFRPIAAFSTIRCQPKTTLQIYQKSQRFRIATKTLASTSSILFNKSPLTLANPIVQFRFTKHLFSTMNPTEDASKKEAPKEGVATPEEIQKFIDEAGDRLVVIDVRNPNAEVEPGDQKSLKVGPLPDKNANIRPKAIHAIWDRTSASMTVPPSLLEDKTVPIITHCGGGGRGQLAKEFLEQKYGFTNIINGGGPKETENWKVFGEK
jgi:rhodanese-related sulfurtransferase